MSDTIGSRSGNINIGTLSTATDGKFDNVISSNTANINNTSNSDAVNTDLVNLSEFSVVEGELREEKVYFDVNSYINTKYDGNMKVLQETIENGVLTERTIFNSDGTRKTEVFDSNGNVKQTIEYTDYGETRIYDATGKMIERRMSLGIAGSYVCEKFNDQGMKTQMENVENGMVIDRTTYTYNTDGTVKFEELFDNGGNLTQKKFFINESSYVVSKYKNSIEIYQELYENGMLVMATNYTDEGLLIDSTTYYTNGNIKQLEKVTDYGKMYINCDENGNIVYGNYNGKNIDIFGNYTKVNDQYGGNQMTISRNATELLQDQNIMNILKETFPAATMEDYELYLNKMTNVGCGYVAHVNTLFKEYEGREQEFLNTFGFSMYNVDANGNIDFNYEYMIVDYMNSTWGNSGHSIEELYGNVTTGAGDAAISGTTSGIMEGIPSTDTASFTSYLKNEYGITATGSSSICVVYDEELEGVQKVMLDVGNFFAGGTDYLKHYESNYGENDRVIIGTKGFDLYTYDENSGGRGELYGDNIGPHGMYITGVTAAGDFIVSSWGEQYVLGLDNIKSNNGFVTFQSIEY